MRWEFWGLVIGIKYTLWRLLSGYSLFTFFFYVVVLFCVAVALYIEEAFGACPLATLYEERYPSVGLVLVHVV